MDIKKRLFFVVSFFSFLAVSFSNFGRFISAVIHRENRHKVSSNIFLINNIAPRCKDI